MSKSTVLVEGKDITVSNLDKVLFPGGTGFTKAEVIQYYSDVSKVLLPHLKNRPVTLVRFPDGVGGTKFFEKNAPRFTPKWIRTFPVPRSEGGVINYILVNDLPTLIWVSNLASLELHPFLHCAPAINRPTEVVFDLDPGEGANLVDCARVAGWVRDALKNLKLACFPKVSGSKGLQLYVPLNTPTTYKVTHEFARALAELLTRAHPDRIVADMAKAHRKRRVFIDWSQNIQSKTTVSVYSLRAKRDQPFVSMPVTWDELDELLETENVEALMFTPKAALERIRRKGDLFAPVLQLKQKLPKK